MHVKISILDDEITKEKLFHIGIYRCTSIYKLVDDIKMELEKHNISIDIESLVEKFNGRITDIYVTHNKYSGKNLIHNPSGAAISARAYQCIPIIRGILSL